MKTERSAIIETYKKYYHKPKRIEDENIRRLVVSGWLLTYSLFKKGNTFITGDKVIEDSAFVFCSVLKLNGEKKHFEVRFVKEDEYWKILGGLKEF